MPTSIGLLLMCCVLMLECMCCVVSFTQDVLSELFKSAEIRDQGVNVSGDPPSSDSKPYRRQLTVEELFKGVSSILFV